MASDKALKKKALKQQGYGKTPSENSATNQKPIDYYNLPNDTKVALTDLRAGSGVNGLDHNSDPVTGHQKHPQIFVKEFYPHGKQDPRRLVSRSDNGAPRVWYYSAKHTERSYWYQEIINLPILLGAPPPAPAPLPGPPPIVAHHNPGPAPLPTIHLPLSPTESWEDIYQ